MASFKHYRVANNEQTPILRGDDGKIDTISDQPFIQRITDHMTVSIVSLTDEEIEFDLTGVDASIANALRRILLAEVSR